jgi:hypothetical protein
MQTDQDKPGSLAAKAAGCTCPVLDNSYGKGIYGLGKDWVVVTGCPLHAPVSDAEGP